MRALSIIGIILSLGGIPTSIVIMTETHCYCYCNDDYFSSGSTVPDEALGGGFTMLLISVFFLVFSIISTVVSFGKKTPPVVVGGPNYTAPFTTYPPYPQPNPQFNNPGQNPYTQNYSNPYNQQPPQNQYQNPPQQNTYQPPSNYSPFQNPQQNNPYQNPPAPKNPYENPNPPKNTYAPPTPPPLPPSE